MTTKVRFLLAGMLIGFFQSTVVAQNSFVCSGMGDYSLDVESRVKAVRYGHISTGHKVLLQWASDDVCESGDHCFLPPRTSISPGQYGVEIARKDTSVCISVPGKKQLEIWSGWLPIERWQPVSGKTDFPAERWLGVWQNEGAKIRISADRSHQLVAAGKAIWSGTFGGPHFGAFEIDGPPKDDLLSNSNDEGADGCELVMRRVGQFIFAADNRKCGALNVTFEGLYRYRFKLQ